MHDLANEYTLNCDELLFVMTTTKTREKNNKTLCDDSGDITVAVEKVIHSRFCQLLKEVSRVE